MEEDIIQFNKAFDLPIQMGINEERQKLFRTLIEEENDELWEAINIAIHRDEKKGLIEILDALVDITYLTIGAYVYSGQKIKFHHSFTNSENMEVDKNKIETYRTSYNFIMDYLDRYESSDNIHNLELNLELILNQVFYLLAMFGLLDKFPEAWKEVQNSNMSKLCSTIDEAEETRLHYSKSGILAYYKEHNDKFIVSRKDGKVLKGINYYRPDLKKLF